MNPRVPPTRPHKRQRRTFIFYIGAAFLLFGFAWFFANKVHSAAPTGPIIGKTGPWGKLECVRINIELPDHFIEVDDIEATDWLFKGMAQDQTIEFFKQCHLDSEQLDILLHKAKWKMDELGCHVAPDDSFICSLNPESHGKIYGQLALWEENVNQFYAFTYRPEQLPDFLKFSGLHEETIQMFKSLLYPQGTVVRFGDTDVVLRKLTDKRERLRLVKTAARRATMLVKLDVTPDADIDALINYWGIGGRSKDLRPLLESLARVPGGCRIDIAHLLPPFARKRIYTYPNPDEDPESNHTDCHWTTLNFFTDAQRREFSSPEDVARTLESEYVEIGSDLSQAKFGDALFVKTSNDILIHSAVYIADDIVFTKNGAGLNQPWIYMRLDDMLAYYSLPNESLRVLIYRRKQI